VVSDDLPPCQADGPPEHLAAQVDLATVQITDRTRIEIPAYRTLTDEQLVNVRETVRDGFFAAMAISTVGELAPAERLQRLHRDRAARTTAVTRGPECPRVGWLGVYDIALETRGRLGTRGQSNRSVTSDRRRSARQRDRGRGEESDGRELGASRARERCAFGATKRIPRRASL
jgi:hypothetical protein